MRLPALAFILLALLALLLVGCAIPVTQKFPEVPPRLMVKCPNLEKLQDDAKLSDVAKTVTINYTTYYECAVKNDAWIEWYQIQQKIFDEAYK
jgi:hypothetical protein